MVLLVPGPIGILYSEASLVEYFSLEGTIATPKPAILLVLR